MDKLVCILCDCSYSTPKMCPSCSQIYCLKCITAYLQYCHFCPACGYYITDVIDCGRLIEEVKEKIRWSKNERFFRNCRVHGLPLKYYCQDCNRLICTDCGIITPEHKTHRIKSKPTMRNDFSSSILKQFLLQLDQKIMQNHTQQQHYLLQKQVLRSQLKWCKNKLLQHYQSMVDKIQLEAASIMEEIVKDLQEREISLGNCKVLRGFIVEGIETYGMEEDQLVGRVSTENYLFQHFDSQGREEVYQQLQDQIQKLNGQHNQFHFVRKSLGTLNQIYPEYSNHTFQFDYSSQKEQIVVYSPSIDIFGHQWRLKIYPKGNAQMLGGCLSLFVELVSAPSLSLSISHKLHYQRYYYRLQLISLNSVGKTISKQYCSLFAPGECWGYTDFLQIIEIPQYLTQGKLIFVMGIKNTSYYDVCENMKRYIGKLESQHRMLQEFISVSQHEEKSNIVDYVELQHEVEV